MMQGKFSRAILAVSVLSVLGCGMADAGYTITCTSYRYPVFVQPNPDVGIVQFDPVPSEDGYETGAVVTLTAIPNIGYKFKEWQSGASLGTSPVLSVTIGVQDIQISAVFWVPERHAPNISVSPPGTGAFTLDPPPGEDGKYDEQTVVSVTAIPSAGHYYWHSNHDNTSECGAETFSYNISTYGLTLYFNQYSAVYFSDSGEWGALSISPTSEDGTYAPGTEITLSATMNPGFSFMGIRFDGTTFQNNPCTVTIRKVCESWSSLGASVLYDDVRPKVLTTTASPVGAGTIQASPPMPEGGYLDDPLVTVTAIANANYKFVRWDGDYAEEDATSSILKAHMDQERTLVAVFEAVSCPECPGAGEGEPDDGETAGCACKKWDFTPEQIKKRLADFFLVGLMLGCLALARKRL